MAWSDRRRRRQAPLGLALACALAACATPGPGAAGRDVDPLGWAPAPVDNPLKGLVPYASAPGVAEGVPTFPHSLEFGYLPLASLVVGPGEYDWAPLDAFLDTVASRGHQAIFRVYLEYPHAPSGVPQYLIDGGLALHEYVNDDVEPPASVATPDWEDPALRAALVGFVEALGARYDGDARIGYVTAGLLGAWGEWHDYPRADLFASKDVQREVLDAYQRAFDVTPILLRRPSGASDEQYASTAERPFGYHDDSFAWATLDTGRPDEDFWYFVPLLRAAGAQGAWKRHPIGGEIRPEAWGRVFDADPGPGVQDFATCVDATHATWLMDSGMFDEGVSPERRERALEAVRRLGYELTVTRAAIDLDGERLHARVAIENRGVAPLYANWPVELGVADVLGVVRRRVRARGGVAGLLPGDERTLEETIDLTGLAPSTYVLLLRVPNPLPNGEPVRFANVGQDLDAEGWMTVGTVRLPPSW